MAVGSVLSEPRVTALLLIGGAVVFAVGGVLFTGRVIWRWPAGQSDRYLRWERSFVIAAVLLTALGLALLEDHLRAAGDPVIARLGTLAYLIAAVVVVVAETSFLHDRDWNYPQIVFYVLTALLAQAAIGVGLLQTGLVAGWIGWATIAWNLGCLVVLPLASPRELYYPAIHHAAPLLIGIALLAR
jgi:hypothetical protein